MDFEDPKDTEIRGNKGNKTFKTISEVAAELELPQHVLRFWESRFSQIKPMKRGGNRRYYRPEDVEILLVIRKLLHSDGFTIRGAQKLFKENGLRQTIDSILSPPSFQRNSVSSDKPVHTASEMSVQQESQPVEVAEVQIAMPVSVIEREKSEQAEQSAVAGKELAADGAVTVQGIISEKVLVDKTELSALLSALKELRTHFS